jgi:hypothetical protein
MTYALTMVPAIFLTGQEPQVDQKYIPRVGDRVLLGLTAASSHSG